MNFRKSMNKEKYFVFHGIFLQQTEWMLASLKSEQSWNQKEATAPCSYPWVFDFHKYLNSFGGNNVEGVTSLSDSLQANRRFRLHYVRLGGSWRQSLWGRNDRTFSWSLIGHLLPIRTFHWLKLKFELPFLKDMKEDSIWTNVDKRSIFSLLHQVFATLAVAMRLGRLNWHCRNQGFI